MPRAKIKNKSPDQDSSEITCFPVAFATLISKGVRCGGAHDLGFTPGSHYSGVACSEKTAMDF